MNARSMRPALPWLGLLVLSCGGAPTTGAPSSPPQPAPTVQAARVAFSLKSYAELKKNEFYSYYQLGEVGRQRDSGGAGSVVTLKPGGHRDAVDVQLFVDDSDRILWSRLLLARSWVGEANRLDPFALDIAAHFLLDLGSQADREQLILFAKALMDYSGTNRKVIRLPGTEPDDLVPPDVRSFLATFAGAAESFQMGMRAVAVSVSNVKRPGGDALQIEMRAIAPDFAPEPEVRVDVAFGGSSIFDAALQMQEPDRPTSILINEKYAQTRDLKPYATSAQSLILQIQLMAVCQADVMPVEVFVFDGKIGHSILTEVVDDEMDHIYYHDPWEEMNPGVTASFLQSDRNAAHVSATLALGAPGSMWKTSTDDLESVLYGTVVYEDFMKFISAAVGGLEKPDEAVAFYTDLAHKKPGASLAASRRWVRIAAALARGERFELSSAAVKVASALEPALAHSNLAKCLDGAKDGTSTAKCIAHATPPAPGKRSASEELNERLRRVKALYTEGLRARSQTAK